MNIKTLTILLFAAATSNGCSGSATPERDTRASVSGSVTLDGKPVDRARIIFVSDAGSGAVKASGVITKGQYNINAESGPLPGDARVEIHSELIDLEEFEGQRNGDRFKDVDARTGYIPVRYNIRSSLKAGISTEGENKFDFPLTSEG